MGLKLPEGDFIEQHAYQNAKNKIDIGLVFLIQICHINRFESMNDFIICQSKLFLNLSLGTVSE